MSEEQLQDLKDALGLLRRARMELESPDRDSDLEVMTDAALTAVERAIGLLCDVIEEVAEDGAGDGGAEAGA